MKAKTPEDSAWFVASMFFQILPGAGVQNIHQVRVASLVEIVDHFANEKMSIQFSSKAA